MQAVGRMYMDLDMCLQNRLFLFVFVVRDGRGLEEGEQDQICNGGGSICEVLRMP